MRTYRSSLAEGTICTRTFFVSTNDPSQTEDSMVQQAQATGPNPVPNPLDLFPGSQYAKLHEYTPSRPWKDRTKWKVVCNYKTNFSQDELDRAANVDPTLRPMKITATSRTIMIPVRSMLRTAAYKGTFPSSPSFSMSTCANSAGDAIDPPLESASTEWELHCEKHFSFLPSWFLNPTYANGVNNANQIITIRGTPYVVPAGYAKLSNLSCSPRKQENNIDFITLQWNMTIRNQRPLFSGETKAPLPWDVEVLDLGMRTRTKVGSTSNTTKWTNVLDSTGSQAITTPIPFNGSGIPIPDDGTGIPEASLYKYCYRPFGPQVDYSVMGYV